MIGLVALLLVVVMLGDVETVRAQEGPGEERASASVSVTRIGDQFTMHLEVVAEPEVEIEIDPASGSWEGVQVIRVDSVTSVPEGDKVRHLYDVTVAAFLPGARTVTPMFVAVVEGLAVPRPLPPVQLQVDWTLAADDPLELNPLPPPKAIDGGPSPWLLPGIAAAGVLSLAILGVAALLIGRWARKRWAKEPVEPELEPVPVSDLGGAERLLDADPVRAYRAMANVVRQDLARRFGLPAGALTTRELQRRMEAESVDRWHARLVTGLLEECDAVVYAGYVPAAERRRADLDMARQIVEAY